MVKYLVPLSDASSWKHWYTAQPQPQDVHIAAARYGSRKPKGKAQLDQTSLMSGDP